ncbi:MAG: glycosyltransferase family 87 protein, partial [Candidatus Tectimicrobiota bacterium]
AELRDEAIYPQINRKEARTIYPPAAQAWFRLIHGLVGDSVTGTKAMVVLADLVTIGLVVVLLGQMGAPLHRVALYAWNPLVIVEVASNGHLDPLYLPAVVGAFLAHRAGRRALVGALVGFATLTKLYPALLVPALHRRGDRRAPLAWAVVVGLGYLPYLGLGRRVLGFLPTYLFNQYEEFNQGVRFFARSLAGGGGEAFNHLYLVVASLGLAGLVWLVVRWGDGSVNRAALGGLLLGGFFLFVVTPALHPWYLLWLLVLGTIAPSVTLVAASWALTLSYLKYAQASGVLPVTVRLAEFLPLLALLVWELVRRRRAAERWEQRPSVRQAVTGLPSPGYGESPP